MPSTIENRFLDRLKSAKAEYAHDALSKPKDKSEYGFGQACGTYAGLLLAEQLFEEVIGEDRDQA